MYKLVAILKRREGMSPEQFRDYYETQHAPLAKTLIPGLRRYVRRYPRPQIVAGYPTPPPLAFDVITELWFDSADDFEQAMAVFSAPEVAALLREDELRLFDREAGVQFYVEEEESEL